MRENTMLLAIFAYLFVLCIVAVVVARRERRRLQLHAAQAHARAGEQYTMVDGYEDTQLIPCPYLHAPFALHREECLCGGRGFWTKIEALQHLDMEMEILAK